MNQNKVFADREILSQAQAKGPFSTLLAYLRLSGPAWLQSAITLGGGSLIASLYLGMAGGYSLLWVQLVAIICGVVMLSAISYITLSTGLRPYPAMNRYVNPVLGSAWITATILANMIFILPQFALAYDALNKNLMPGQLDGSDGSKWMVSIILGVVALVIVFMSMKRGLMHRLFDLLLKLIVGAIVICFVVAVVQLFLKGEISWDIFRGFIPELSQLTKPAEAFNQLIVSDAVPTSTQDFWDQELVSHKQNRMIASAATAVGINMTFLWPYSLLSRGWDKTFRGLAVWDLVTGMAIPFVIVTSCIVITTSYGLHSSADEKLLDSDPDIVITSPFFSEVAATVETLIEKTEDQEKMLALKSFVNEPEETAQASKNAFLAKLVAQMSDEEKKLAVGLAKPNSSLLAASLEPLLGKQNSQIVFGLGAFAMGFSTIVVLMMINGFALGEIIGDYQKTAWRMLGALGAGAVGVCWVIFWKGASLTYLSIVASTFAILLLPIAYFAFLLMMNNNDLMEDSKPRGMKMVIWNVLMFLSLAIVSFAAFTQLQVKLADKLTGPMVLGGMLTFGILLLVGFTTKVRRGDDEREII